MASSSNSQTRCFQGPNCVDVFCLQSKHISSQVFSGQRDRNVAANVRKADGNVWAQWDIEMDICPGTANYVAQMGFGTFFKLGHMRNDHLLLHALLERFRPETMTFHLPVGEAMISLEDVEVLLGLRAEGYIVGSNPNQLEVADGDWESYVKELLGLKQLPHGKSYFKCDWLKTSHLETRLGEPVTFTEGDMQQRARCFVLWMLGNGLFINSKKVWVHKDMVLCVVDFNVCRGYSWGSAVLAYLLREMCRCVLSPVSKTIYMNGATQLLQFWAYERIGIFTPKFHNVGDETGMPVNGGPLGSRYTNGRSMELRWKLPTYRDQLSAFLWEQFAWTPYTHIARDLPADCNSGMRIYLSTVPLICRSWVGFHNPHRCIRQFGGLQTVPLRGLVLTEQNWEIHVVAKYSSDGSMQKWRNEYLIQYENMWEQRHHQNIYQGPLDLIRVPQPDPQYLTWYRENYVRYILDPDVRSTCGINPHGERLVYQEQRISDLPQMAQGWTDPSAANELHAYVASTLRSPWIDPPPIVPPTQVMRNPPAEDAAVRQRRHRRTREEALATQQAYNQQQPEQQPAVTPEQHVRRGTRAVGRRDSHQHVRPTRDIGLGTRPRRIYTPENETDESD